MLSTSFSELFTGDISKDNHSPRPVIREVIVHSPHKKSKRYNAQHLRFPFVRCPQGTVLGTLLLLLYSNDITDIDSEWVDTDIDSEMDRFFSL